MMSLDSLVDEILIEIDRKKTEYARADKDFRRDRIHEAVKYAISDYIKELERESKWLSGQ